MRIGQPAQRPPSPASWGSSQRRACLWRHCGSQRRYAIYRRAAAAVVLGTETKGTRAGKTGRQGVANPKREVLFRKHCFEPSRYPLSLAWKESYVDVSAAITETQPFLQTTHYSHSLGWSVQQPEAGVADELGGKCEGSGGFRSSKSPDWAQLPGCFCGGPRNAENRAENIRWSWTFFKAQNPTTISREHLSAPIFCFSCSHLKNALGLG